MAELMPEGQYQGNVISAEWGSTSSGNPQIVVTFALAEGVNRTVYIVMTDKTMGTDENGKPRMAQQMLNTLGWNGDDPPTFQKNENIPLWMKHDAYEGKTKEKWQISSGSFSGAKPSQDVISRMQSQWRATNGAAPQPTTKPPANAPAVPQRAAPQRPAESKPGDEYAKYTTAESVFSFWTKIREKAKKSASSDDWFEFLDSLNLGKKDTEFGPADWKKAAEVADLPF